MSYTKLRRNCRGVAQLVARTAGGREVAGSSPVTPTTIKTPSEVLLEFLYNARQIHKAGRRGDLPVKNPGGNAHRATTVARNIALPND